MSDLSLGALSAQLKIDMDGLDASVKKAVGGLDKIEQKADETAKKTENVGKVMKDALKGEVLVNAGNRIGSTLQQVGGEFAGLGKAVTGVGAILQGFFQGQGFGGAAIAAFGVGVSAVTQALAEAEQNSRKITEMWAKDLQARLDQLDAIHARIGAINAGIAGASAVSAAAGVSAATGLSVDTSQQFAALDQAEIRKSRAQERLGLAQRNARGGGDLAQQDLRLASAELAEASAALTKLEADLGAQADRERADSLRRVSEEKNARAMARKDAMQGALKEARNWLPEGLRTPGELARMARDDDGGTEGLSAKERRDRAARDAGYAANASDTLVLDKPLRRITETFEQAADYVTGGVLDSLRTFADSFADAMETAADVAGAATQEVWSKLAPKTFEIASAAASGDIGGAIAAALSHSVEFQAVGKALDSGLVEIVNAISEVLRPAVPVITMAIRAVVEAAKLVMGIVDVVASALQLDTVFAIVFEAVKFLAALLSAGAFAVQYALDGLQNAFKNAAIGFLSLGIFAGAFQTQVDDLKKSLVVQGDFVAGASKAFDDIMKIGFNAEIAAVGLGDAADAANKVAASFLNLPAGFKTAAAIYGATSASSAPFGGYAPPAAPGLPPLAAAAGASGGGSGGGDVFNFYAPIYVSGDEGFTNVVTVSARQSGMAGSGTTGGRQSNRQSPTPHAPNASQPYTPVP